MSQSINDQPAIIEQIKRDLSNKDWCKIENAIASLVENNETDLLTTDFVAHMLHIIIAGSAPISLLRRMASLRQEAIAFPCPEILLSPTPIHAAASRQSPEMLQVLLEIAINPSQAVLLKDKYHQTPLHYACSSQAPLETIELLVNTNKQVIHTMARGWHPLRVLYDCYSSRHNPVEHAFVKSVVEDHIIPSDAPLSLEDFMKKVEFLSTNSATPSISKGKGMSTILHSLLRTEGHVENLILFYVHFAPHLLLMADSEGDLPLHTLLKVKRSRRRVHLLVKSFLKEAPMAAFRMNYKGLFPLHVGIRSKLALEDGLRELIASYQPAIATVNPLNGLLPFQEASLANTDESLALSFHLLSLQPDLCQPHNYLLEFINTPVMPRAA